MGGDVYDIVANRRLTLPRLQFASLHGLGSGRSERSRIGCGLSDGGGEGRQHGDGESGE
jgi:hypothetical protein